jgi:hypothetical protein
MSLGMGEFLSMITGPSGGILSPTLTAAVAEHEQQLIADGHGGAYYYTAADGRTSVTLDPKEANLQTGVSDYVHAETGLPIEVVRLRPPGVQVAQNGVRDTDPLGYATNALGKLNNLPNTLVGLSVGVIDSKLSGQYMPFVRLGNNAIEFTNVRALALLAAHGGAQGLTIGNVILYSDFNAASTLGAHEIGHTYQGEAFGQFYLPLHAITGAYSMATSWGNWWANNPLEQELLYRYGPQD